MRVLNLTTLAITAAVAFAAGGALAQSGSALDQVIQEQFTALNAKDPARLQATFTDDSVKMEEGIPMIKGKAEIVKGFAEGMTRGLFSDMQGKTLESVISGDLGYATYSGSHLDGKGVKQTWHGVSIFKRVGRQWKVAVDASMNDAKP